MRKFNLSKLTTSLVFLSCMTLVSCTLNQGGDKKKSLIPVNAMSDEFIFAGDKQVVQNTMNDLNLQASFLPIDPENQSYVVHYKGEARYEEIASALNGKVRYVEPNYIVEPAQEGLPDIASPEYLPFWPKDQLFFYQYGYINIGQSAPWGLPGKPGADMGLLKVWQELGIKGSKDIVVAVLDSGIDYTHEDLRDNMWVNTKEAKKNGGLDGVNDDEAEEAHHKARYTDDVHGFDFTSENRRERWHGIIGDPDPMDPSGHGTHCAGSIGAAHNDLGILGVNAHVSLMALRVLGQGGGTTGDTARAILYAADKGAHIISASLGGGGRSEVMLEAIKYAQEKGVLMVVASGNDGQDNDLSPSYPAGFDEDSDGNPIENIISVGASDNQDYLATFSNYGRTSVDVIAPGVAIVGTYTTKKEPEFPYMIMSGTSMSAPYVAGIAALMMSHNPDLIGQPKMVRDILIHTSDKKQALIGKSVSNGRVNAYKALRAGKDIQSIEPVWMRRAESIREPGYYTELVDIRHEIFVEGATAIRVHFDKVMIDHPFDSVYLYDRDERLISTVYADINTRSYRDYWSAVIPGDKVYVRFVNSKLRKIEFLTSNTTKSSCASAGGQVIGPDEESDKKVVCQTDAKSSKNTNTYISFESDGFSIDAIEYTTDPSFNTFN